MYTTGFRPVGFPGTKERNHHCIKFWWGFRDQSSGVCGDSVQWGFRLVGIPVKHLLTLYVNDLLNTTTRNLVEREELKLKSKFWLKNSVIEILNKQNFKRTIFYYGNRYKYHK